MCSLADGRRRPRAPWTRFLAVDAVVSGRGLYGSRKSKDRYQTLTSNYLPPANCIKLSIAQEQQRYSSLETLRVQAQIRTKRTTIPLDFLAICLVCAEAKCNGQTLTSGWLKLDTTCSAAEQQFNKPVISNINF